MISNKQLIIKKVIKNNEGREPVSGEFSTWAKSSAWT